MKFEERLRTQMLARGFNQQRLARASGVSDSEVSRILNGKSGNPGLVNAQKLARALGVSLDSLVEDEPLTDPATALSSSLDAEEGAEPAEQELLDVARKLGVRPARRILEICDELGYEIAIRRLLEIKPVIEVGEGVRPVTTNSISASATVPVALPDRRASSA